MDRFRYPILIVIFICSCASTGKMSGIHYAVENNQLSEVKSYVDRGDLELPDRNGLTPLIFASYHGHISIVKYLCEKGAMVNQTDNKGWTALMYAAYYNFIEITRILLDHNAKKEMVNTKGFTALYYAEKFNHKDIVMMISPEKAVRHDVPDTKILTKPVAEGIYRIAIFPWASYGRVREDIEYPLKEIIERIESDKLFDLTYSFYKTGNPEYDRNNNISFINKNNIWLGRKPNLNYIFEIAERLKIDTAILGTYDLTKSRTTYTEIYFVDIKSKRQFSESLLPAVPLGEGSSRWLNEFGLLLSSIFKKYKTGIIQQK